MPVTCQISNRPAEAAARRRGDDQRLKGCAAGRLAFMIEADQEEQVIDVSSPEDEQHENCRRR